MVEWFSINLGCDTQVKKSPDVDNELNSTLYLRVGV